MRIVPFIRFKTFFIGYCKLLLKTYPLQHQRRGEVLATLETESPRLAFASSQLNCDQICHIWKKTSGEEKTSKLMKNETKILLRCVAIFVLIGFQVNGNLKLSVSITVTSKELVRISALVIHQIPRIFTRCGEPTLLRESTSTTRAMTKNHCCASWNSFQQRWRGWRSET